MPNAEITEREIFVAAHALTPDERGAYLEKACVGQPEMMERVQSLLAASETDDDLFESPALTTTIVPDAPSGNDSDSLGDDSGKTIGRYKLLQRIGEGGMAVVYMAEQQQPVRRKVAVKVIKPGMDSKSVIVRFEAERQALARMDHPNIARIFDGGTTEQGRPYFVMELVRGVPITEYCDSHQLNTEDRLNLFINVCNAVQHAHQKGIIHRDVKPTNILVTEADGQPIPKVIDFGIAKATQKRLTDKTLFTQFHSFVGTPAYMSPEQAQMGALDIDTRADIYALGVLLYELLTGCRPFNSSDLSSFDKFRRTILEKEPPLPSTRVSKISSDDLQATASRRRAEPKQLVHSLRSDLDWITMKCLEKDRSRRYQTASDLVQDIQRFLKNEAVVARPPSTAYRTRKFIRRNKVAVGIGCILLVATIVSAWQAIRATIAVGEQNRLRTAVESALEEEADQRKRAESGEAAALQRAYSSDMTLTQIALENNNYGRAVGLLERYTDTPATREMRNWEWRYFWNQTRSEAEFSLPQQSDSITRVELSEDGRVLVTGDLSGTIKLWDLHKQKTLLEISQLDSQRAAVALSQDDNRLAYAVTKDGTTSVVIRTIADRKIVRQFDVPFRPWQLEFAKDDDAILLIGWNNRVDRMILEDGLLETLIPASPNRQWSRAYSALSPDRTLLARPTAAGVQVWNLDSGKQVGEFEGHGSETWSLAFSPDGTILACGPTSAATSTDIKLYSLTSGSETGHLSGHTSWVPAITFSSNGRQLVSSGGDQTIRIWDVSKKEQRDVFYGHLTEIYCVAASSDGQRIVSGSKNGSLLFWDPREKKERNRYETLPIPVTQIAFVSGSDELLAVDPNGRVTLWDAQTLQPLESIDSIGENVLKIVVSSDGNRVYANTRGGKIKVLDWSTRHVVTELPSASERRSLEMVGLTDNDRVLAIRSGSSTFELFDAGSMEPKKTLEVDVDSGWGAISSVTKSGSPYLAFGGIRRPLYFVDLATGETTLLEEAQPAGASDIAFSPGANIIAASSLEGVTRFWDTSNSKLVNELRGHLIGINAVTFSPDGTRFVSASQGDEAVKLWDVSTGLEVTTLPGEGFIERGLTFSPDGNLLVATNSQNKAMIWRAP